jgi:phenylpropionate dioxygenase-like ring-hydroxylating dioxygenase large terminal subunit
VAAMSPLLDDRSVVQRVLDHIENKTTDTSEECWREPVAHYRLPERLEQERSLVLRRYPTAFCPSAALPEAGSFIAREAGGTPLVAVRGRDGIARVFRNACRHRGTQIAEGSGCAKAFECPYHGWTYALDGRLQGVPHEHGFPGLEKSQLGLVPVAAVERHGLLFVTQDGGRAPDAELDDLAGLIPPNARLIESNERETAANWKILVDSFLEGYHTRFTHRETFYPVQYDNLSVVETFGSHHRITFPFRTIEKLRHVPPAERRIDGRVLTYVYHLFPNVSLVTLPEHIRLLVYEPISVDRTRVFGYTLVRRRRATRAGAMPSTSARARSPRRAGSRTPRSRSRSSTASLAAPTNRSFSGGSRVQCRISTARSRA